MVPTNSSWAKARWRTWSTATRLSLSESIAVMKCCTVSATARAPPPAPSPGLDQQQQAATASLERPADAAIPGNAYFVILCRQLCHTLCLQETQMLPVPLLRVRQGASTSAGAINSSSLCHRLGPQTSHCLQDSAGTQAWNPCPAAISCRSKSPNQATNRWFFRCDSMLYDQRPLKMFCRWCSPLLCSASFFSAWTTEVLSVNASNNVALLSLQCHQCPMNLLSCRVTMPAAAAAAAVAGTATAANPPTASDVQLLQGVPLAPGVCMPWGIACGTAA